MRIATWCNGRSQEDNANQVNLDKGQVAKGRVTILRPPGYSDLDRWILFLLVFVCLLEKLISVSSLPIFEDQWDSTTMGGSDMPSGHYCGHWCWVKYSRIDSEHCLSLISSVSGCITLEKLPNPSELSFTMSIEVFCAVSTWGQPQCPGHHMVSLEHNSIEEAEKMCRQCA